MLGPVFSTKYLHNQDLFSAVPKVGMSSTWASILRGRDILFLGLQLSVGNGESIRFWLDKWALHEPFVSREDVNVPEEEKQWTVRDYLTPMGGWNWSLIQGALSQSLCNVLRGCIAYN